ncbi:70 kDa peptidyl-prolyl isomerase-like [Silene latifolia]|uniref:70 kDa peptidyl-prolyl isomerase-like n=1 Tax=Silene latifolia TaxID=37657 RepID=UPI003D785026
MATISIDKIFLKHFVVAHGNGEFKEDDWSLFSSFLPMEETHLTKVNFLKESGNNFFKQNLFDSAGGCYEMECRLLCLVLESREDYDVEYVLQLAISLNLNLASCANKLHEYEVAINFCSLVLSSNPKNAKALFRRAVACMKTNMLMEAQTDLETVLMLEPKNKDILIKLNVVKNLRAINHNGKRSIEDQLLCEVARECKRPIPNDNTGDITVNEKGGLLVALALLHFLTPLSWIPAFWMMTFL